MLAWVTKTAITGFRKPLQLDDLPANPRWLNMMEAREKAIAGWKAESSSNRQGGPDLLWGLWWPLGKRDWVASIALGSLTGIMQAAVKPVLLIYVIRATDKDSSISYAGGFALCGCISLVLWLEGWSRGQSMHHGGDRAPLLGIGGTMLLIGEKSYRLKTGEGAEGAETALVGNDLIRAIDFLKFIPLFFQSIAGIVGGLCVLVVFLGFISLVGVGVMALVMLGTIRLSRIAKVQQAAALAAADATATAIREAVDGVKVVKMLTWEVPPSADPIPRAERRAERHAERRAERHAERRAKRRAERRAEHRAERCTERPAKARDGRRVGRRC